MALTLTVPDDSDLRLRPEEKFYAQEEAGKGQRYTRRDELEPLHATVF